MVFAEHFNEIDSVVEHAAAKDSGICPLVYETPGCIVAGVIGRERPFRVADATTRHEVAHRLGHRG